MTGWSCGSIMKHDRQPSLHLRRHQLVGQSDLATSDGLLSASCRQEMFLRPRPIDLRSRHRRRRHRACRWQSGTRVDRTWPLLLLLLLLLQRCSDAAASTVATPASPWAARPTEAGSTVAVGGRFD